MQPKGLFESRTFWLAALQAIAAAAVIFSGAFPMVGWILLLKSVVDVALRYFTENPIVGLFSPPRMNP